MFTRMKKLSFVLLLIAACLAMPVTGMASQKQLQGPGLHRGHTTALIADEVRHQFVTVLACGFLRLKCESCGKERLLPLSCKGRSVCPSCCGRRMVDTAAHLVDRVFPRVPVRQWVLSFPHDLRYRLAYDASLVTDVLGIFTSTIFASLL